MDHHTKLQVVFFRTDTGNEPVRQWLRDLDKEDKKTIGGDIQMVQYRWPVGKPFVEKIKGYQNLWEVRSKLRRRREARVLFTVKGSKMAILHGLMKKKRKISRSVLAEVDRRKNLWRNEEK